MEKYKRFLYDEESPSCLIRNTEIRSGNNGNKINVQVGDIAGGLSPTSGYYQVRVDSKLTLVHRVIWEMFNGPIPEGMFIDHIDRNKLNNKLENLRLVTRAGNNRNQKLREDSSSGIAGVNLCVNTLRSGSESHYWRAVWSENGKVRSKAFPVKVHGEQKAFELACEFRLQMIQALNEKGAGYTETHGKEKQ